jgi:hypothetical protein
MAINNSSLYSIGQGDAQVINNNGLLAGFGQLLAKQQAQRAKEQKDLEDANGKLKPDGLRNDADRKDFFTQVDGWRQKAIAANQEKDPYKRAALKAEADDAYIQAQALVNKSKQQAAKDTDFQRFAMNDTTRHQLQDDAVTKGLSNLQKGVNDPTLVDYATLGRQVDHAKQIDKLDKSDAAALKQTPFDTPQLTRQKVGNQMTTFVQNGRTLDPNDRAQMYSQMYDTDPDIRKFFDDIYPDIHAASPLNPQGKKQAAIQRYIQQSGDVAEFHAPVAKNDYHPPVGRSGGSGSAVEPGMPVDMVIPYQTPEGKPANVSATGYVPISVPKKNFAGLPAYSLTDGGRPTNLQSSGDYNIVGVGNFPVLKTDITVTSPNGKKQILKAGSLAQPDYVTKHPESVVQKPMIHVQLPAVGDNIQQDFVMDYNKFPENVKNSKQVAAALKNFTPAGTPLVNKNKKAATDYGL